jgi:tRNA (cytidine/uridine-2'-O-)-methyltransferase
MAINIVLIEPEIPNNTGNIGRLSLAAGAKLHLVKPFGFELSDKRVKRAGLDYWKHVDLHIYEDSDSFFEKHQNKHMVFLSSHGQKIYTDIEVKDDIFIVFGKESNGLGDEIREKYKEHLYCIPIFSSHVRSLNLANAVSIVVYSCINSGGN